MGRSACKRILLNSRVCIGLLLCLGLLMGIATQVRETQASNQSPTDTQVEQAVLLIRQSTQTSVAYSFSVVVAQKMNISYTIFNADKARLNTTTLYDGQVGRFSLVAVTAEAMNKNLNSTQRTLLDNYEDQFGVAEALLGPVPSALTSRYGVSSLGNCPFPWTPSSACPRFTTLRWASNGLTNSMNTSMAVTTLGANTSVYSYGGNGTQSNPVVWSFTSGNKVRVGSSIQSISPFKGDDIPYWATFWLASKLSTANKILKFYWSVDIDDLNDDYSDSGIYGAPAVSNLYLNGSDITNMVTNFITPLGFNPTLAIEYDAVNNKNMTTTYPMLESSLLANQDKFDFTPHTYVLYQSTTSYQTALNTIRMDDNAISRWGFLPTLYYMVPGKYNYSSVAAPAITDSPVWYVNGVDGTTDTVPNIKHKLSLFDVWSPGLFRVATTEWWTGAVGLDYNIRSAGQLLNASRLGTWNNYWYNSLEDQFSMYGFASYWGGYRIESTHFENWVNGRASADAPALQVLKNATGIGILPVVPVRSWALAENAYFIRNFKFTAIYDITQNTLTYSILKANPAARDRITLVLQGNVRPVDFEPLILSYDQQSTMVTLNYQSSITLKLGQQETVSPHIVNYQTSMVTAATLTSNEFNFTISAAPGTTSTTKIFLGNRTAPASVWVNGARQNTIGNYDPSSDTLTMSLNHVVQQLNVGVIWNPPDFSVTPSSTSVTLLAGATGTSSVTVAPLYGFTGTVALSATFSPSTGLSCSLSPASITLGASQTSTLSCNGSSGNYTVTVTGTSGSLSHPATVNYVVQDFQVSASPSSMAVNVGQAGTSTITIGSINGFSGIVNLAESVSPSTGLTCALSPTSITGSGTSTLSCTPSASGSFTVTVTGTSDSLSHSTTVTYSVAVPDFSVNTSPASVTVLADTTGTSTVTVSPINGFTGTVDLEASVAPSTGLSCSLSPTSITLGASQTSTLSCSGIAGSYTVTVTGTSGTLTHTGTVSYTVQDFSLTASPTSLTASADQAVNSTITVGPIQGFTGTVSLASSVSPSGLTCGMDVTSIVLGSSQTSTLSCSGTAGVYTVTVTGVSGDLSHSATITVTIQDFTITASPYSTTVLTTDAGNSTIVIAPVNGFTGTVTLTSAISPRGLTCSLDTTSITLGDSQTSTLSCSGPAGTYTTTVTGTSGSLSRSTNVTFTIQDFLLTASPTNVPVNVGQSGNSTVTVTGINGFNANVSLSAINSPSTGLSCALAPTSITRSGTSTLTCTPSTSGTFTVTVTGTDGSLSHSTTITYSVPMPDFSVSASSTSVTVTAATTGGSTITVAPVNGFTGTVTLTLSVSPSTGLACSISPASITLGSSQSSTLSCAGSAGAYNVTVTGTSGSLSHSASVNFNVTDFTLTASPTSVPVNVGQAGSSTITVTAANGFNGVVSLGASVSPSTGLTCTLSPPSVTGSGSATLSCTPSASGSFTVTVTGTSDSLSHSATVTYSVAVPDFTLTASPASVTVNAGAAGASTITVAPVNGFTGTVALTSSVSPASGLTCTLSPTSITLGTSGTSTLSCNGSAGVYTIIVTGTSSGSIHTATVTITVQDFTETASPTSVSVNAGTSGTSTITVTSQNGLAGTVNLTSAVSPAGLTCTLSPPSVALGSSGTSTLSCSGSAGNYIVTVTGTSGSLSHLASVNFVVQDFQVSASPASVAVNVGQAGTSTITIGSINGFSGTVSLAASVSPSTGLTCTLSPPSVTGSGSATLSCTPSASGSFTVTVTANSAPLSHSTNVIYSVAAPDFSITANPTSLTVLAGSTGTSTITVAPINGFAGTVTLAVSVSPSTGLICSVSPSSISSGSGTSTLSCSGSAGTYTVTVTGTGNGLTHSAAISYKVQDFSVAGSPTGLTVLAGSKGTSTITAAGLQGFTGTVALTANVSPSTGLTCKLSLTSVVLNSTTTSGTSTLSCSGSAGSYIVTVTGTSSSLSHSATVAFKVQDFSVTASPASVTVLAGSNGASTATVTGFQGFTGTVSLSYTVSPSKGLSCALTPTSISLSSITISATSGVSCSGSAGSYTVTVTGTSSSLTHSATVSFIVQDFTVAASPNNLTVKTGAVGTSTITVTGLSGFTGTVALSDTVSPSSGLTCTLSSTSIALGGTTTSGTSTLSCSGVAGTYTVTVTGASGSLSHSTTVTYKVSSRTATPPLVTSGGAPEASAPSSTEATADAYWPRI